MQAQMLFMNLAFAAATLLGLRGLRARPGLAALLRAVLGAQALFVFLGVFALFALHWRVWGVIQLLAWVVFVHAPLGLFGAAALTRRAAPGVSRAAAVTALAVVALGVDAFFIEPRWLARSEHVLALEGLTEPLTVALIADLQTDDPGAHEAAALELAMAARPDLLLFAGDYLHVEPDDPAPAQRAALNALLRERLAADWPMVAVAVEGDVDRGDWRGLFAGTGVQALADSQTLDLGAVALTALSVADSRSPAPPVPALDKPHLVLGHSPDFAMARPPAALLLAGHTHGGQVRLPLIGPLMTLSVVPRAWAAGLTALPWGGHLVVSRGVGMERREAPRLRLLCRPEVVILRLVPG